MAGANVRVRVAERLRLWIETTADTDNPPMPGLYWWTMESEPDWCDRLRSEALAAAELAESIAYAEPPILRPGADDFDRVDYAETIEAIGRQVREDRRALCR